MEDSSSKLNRLLIDAAEKNDLKTVKLFIEERGGSAKVTNDQGQTLVHIAAKNGNIELVKYIVEREPELMTQPGKHYVLTAIKLAVKSGALDVVKYLVETFRRDVSNPLDNDMETVIPLVIEFGRLDIFKYFVEEKNVDINMPGKWQNQPPIFQAIDHQQSDIIKYLVEENKANLTAHDWVGENILWNAVRRDDFALMKYLLDERKVPQLNVKARNNRGETLVHKAAILNRMNILKYLVDEKHIDVNIRDEWDNMTALHFAAIGNHYESCKYLIEHGANTRWRDNTGQIPAEKTSDEALRELLSPQPSTTRNRRHVDAFYSTFQRVPISRLEIRASDENTARAPTDTSVYWSQFQNLLVLAGPINKYTAD
jgi:ankyrin repeat protein